jgi:S-(hydroxymethyl)glutathione dehydrogenase/alcohol dehydrogenase
MAVERKGNDQAQPDISHHCTVKAFATGGTDMVVAAVQMKTHGPLEMIDVDVRPPGPGEVRVRMAAAGVCHTDAQALEGDVGGYLFSPPLVVGHEGAGRVIEVGPGVTSLQNGDHVVLSTGAHDGTCEFCRDGNPALCVRGLQLATGDREPALSVDGVPVNLYASIATFASEITVPAETAFSIDKRVPFDVACLLGCAVATGVGAVRNRARVQPGQHTVVFGCGGVGLNIVQAARLAGAATVVAVDINDAKLEAAKQFGATHTVNSSTDDAIAAVRDVSGGYGAHHAFESSGLAVCMSQAITSIRPGGQAVLLGMSPSTVPLTIDNVAGFIVQEKVITGSLQGSGFPARDLSPMVAEYLDGKLKLDELITRRRPLAEVNDALDDLRAGNGLRTVLTF